MKVVEGEETKYQQEIPSEVTIHKNGGDYMKDIIKNKKEDYKILCWTNARCDTLNRLVRRNMYGPKCYRYMNNERMIVKTLFMNKDEIVFTTNEEFILDDVQVKEISSSEFDFIPLKYRQNIEGGIRVDVLKVNDTSLYVVRDEHKHIITDILKKIKSYAGFARRFDCE